MVKTSKSFAPAKLALSVAVALAAMASAPASAFIIMNDPDQGTLRLDTTVRANVGWRMSGVDSIFADNYTTDETASVFKKHDVITKRLDVLIESDYVNTYANGLSYGARVTAAGWSENAYPDQPQLGDKTGSTIALSNYGPNRKWSSYAKRYVTGSSGELLDAFIFSSFALGDTNLDVKLGKQTVAWGEALYADGVNVYQAPIDAIKAVSSPGSQTKEIFMPINQLSANWQINSRLAILGDYQLDWAPTRNAPAGTFFSTADASGNLLGSDPMCAGTVALAANYCMKNLDAIKPSRNGGSFGIGARYVPEWIGDGSLGFYYRKFDEMNPWASYQKKAAPATGYPLGTVGLRLSYARDTELFGFSATNNVTLPIIGTANAAMEFVYRKNTALNSNTFNEGAQGGVAGTWISTESQTPSYGQVEGARGNTMHLIFNMITLLNQSFWYETGTLTAELGYQRLDKVTKNPLVYKAEGYACAGPTTNGVPSKGNKGDGCSTKEALKAWISFTPTWMNALPSIDLKMPMSFNYGIYGNSPVVAGAVNEGAYGYSIGLTANYRNRYDFGILYAGTHKDYKAGVTTGALTGAYGVPGAVGALTTNGSGANLNSHRWLGVNFKTTF